ncbi:MAG: YfhO family protein, partial [Bacteroidales bacterium]|nr:YfhO family protein [Bacteroidales bacterium]
YNPDAPPVINPYHSGNAWFVENPVMAANANEEISAIKNLDPAHSAIIDRQFGDLVPAGSYPVENGDTISLVSYQPNELLYKYSAGSEKLVVFSEIYYPAGWKCFVDNIETPYFRANYVLRAMVAPAGEHEIRFSFEPESFATGNRVSLAGSILLILLTGGYLVSRLVRKSKSRPVNGTSQ